MSEQLGSSGGTGPDGAPDGSQSLGLVVCRLSLDPETGRMKHGNRVGIAIRGALFAELILGGRVAGLTWPAAFGESETGDKLPDSVHAAVTRRHKTSWKRWFSHVGADLDAATSELIRLGLWNRDASGRIDDADPGVRLAQSYRINQVLAAAKAGRSADSIGELPPDDAAVALLATGAGLLGGRPRPRAAIAAFDPLLPSLSGRPKARSAFGSSGQRVPPDERDVLRAAVRASLIAMRGQAGARFMSG